MLNFELVIHALTNTFGQLVLSLPSITVTNPRISQQLNVGPVFQNQIKIYEYKISKCHDTFYHFPSFRYYLASLVHPSLPQETTVFQHLLQCAPPLMIANVFLDQKRSVPPLMNNNVPLHRKINAKPTTNKFAPPPLKTNVLCTMNNNAQLLPNKNVTCTTPRNAQPFLTRNAKLTLTKFARLSQLRNANL